MNPLKSGIPTAFILIGIVCLLTWGCSSQTGGSFIPELDPLELTRDLTIPADNPEALIGSFDGIAVGGADNIYTTDSRLQKIHVFSSDGAYLDSLGREGNGPGEFQGLYQVKILADTLYAWDNDAGRITLFDLESLQSIKAFIIPQEELNGARMGSPLEMFPASKAIF